MQVITDLRAPGVYAYEVPSEVKPIERIGTSTAAFVGPTPQGRSAPMRVTSLEQYRREFEPSTGVGQLSDMGLALLAFFNNGGRVAYVARVAFQPGQEKKATGKIVSRADGKDVLGLEVKVASAEELVARLTPEDPATTTIEDGSFTLQVGRMASGRFQLVEQFSGLSFAEKDANDAPNPAFVRTRVDAESTLVNVTTVATPDAANPTELTGKAVAHAVVSGLLEPSPDPTAVVGRKLVVVHDGNPVNVVFDTSIVSMKLLAEHITNIVGGGASVVFQAGRLMLSSDKTLSIDETGSHPDALGVLRLRAIDGATTGSGALLATIAVEGVVAGGLPGQDGGQTEYAAALSALEKIRDVSIVCLPTQRLPNTGYGNTLVDMAIAHAEKLKDRVVIVDPPGSVDLSDPQNYKIVENVKKSSYATLYYPWIEIANPSHREGNGLPPILMKPPSSFAAGVWARTDASRGVWKAPAGVQTGLFGARGLERQVEDAEQDVLNPKGVDCIRALPGYGIVVWGARTLATDSEPPWRYLPVRRTAIMLRESIRRAIQWAVFEPNDERLWSSLRLNVDAFLNGLFRAGAFQGTRASDAYRVRCGLGVTMEQPDIDTGYVRLEVEFAPLRPAEFVVVLIQQKVAQQQ